MNRVNSRFKIDWQLVLFLAIAFLIAWSIAFTFGTDDDAIHATYSPLVATIIIYLPKFAFSISGLVMFWYTKRLKELWARLTHWRVNWIWYVLAYFGPALLYLVSALVSSLWPLVSSSPGFTTTQRAC